MRPKTFESKSDNAGMKFAVAIFTLNEQANILDCIDSVGEFGRVFVIDSNSSDKTVELAKSRDVEVLSFSWNGHYPRKKQWTLQQLSEFDRVVMLDADLRMTPEVIEEIKSRVSRDVDSVLCPIRYYFMDKEIRHGLRVYYTAVLNPKNCSYPDIELSNEGYGDIEFHYQPIVSKKSLRLKHGIIHKDNDPLSSWVCRHHKYAEYEAKMSYSRDRKTEYVHHKTIRGRLFHLIPFKATTRFFFSYFIFFGFLDGVRGFRYQFLLAQHYYLSKVFLDELKKTLQLLK